MLAAASSPYQTFGGHTGVPSAEPNSSDSRKSSKPNRAFLALIASLALLSLLGFAAHSGSDQQKKLLPAEAKSFAQQNSRPHIRAHATNPEKSCHVHRAEPSEGELRDPPAGRQLPEVRVLLPEDLVAPSGSREAVPTTPARATRPARPGRSWRTHRLQVWVEHGVDGGSSNNFRVLVYLDGRQAADEVYEGGPLPPQGSEQSITAWPEVTSKADEVGSVWRLAFCVGSEEHRWCRQAYTGQPTKIDAGKKLPWTVDTWPRMEVSMRVWLRKKGAFFQIGNTDEEEFPLLYFRGRENNGGVCDKEHKGKEAAMTVAFEKDSASGQTKKEIPNSKGVPCREWTDVRVLIDNLQVQLYVGGQLVEDFEINEKHEVIAEDRQVWIAGKWNNDAEGEIKDIEVCVL